MTSVVPYPLLRQKGTMVPDRPPCKAFPGAHDTGEFPSVDVRQSSSGDLYVLCLPREEAVGCEGDGEGELATEGVGGLTVLLDSHGVI